MPKVCLANPSTFGLGTLLGVAIVNCVGGVYREAQGLSDRGTIVRGAAGRIKRTDHRHLRQTDKASRMSGVKALTNCERRTSCPAG